jgi:hypothetical protein
MNDLENGLYRTRKTIREVCRELDLDFDLVYVTNLSECSDCNIWLKHAQLKPDLDDNPICPQCLRFNGM